MNTPKPYLSPSQIDLWLKSPTQYKKRYFEGIEGFVTKEMHFGKQYAEQLESEDLLTSEIKLEGSIGEIKLMGICDKCDIINHEIIEYKTGKTAWTQDKVDNSIQLGVYCYLYNQIHGVIPKVKLIWNETANSESAIEFTGVINEFWYEYTSEKQKTLETLISRVYEEISQAWLEYNKTDNELENTLAEYQEALYKIQKAQAKIDMLKPLIFEEAIKQGGITRDWGTFYLTKTKKYKYPESVTELEKSYKQAKKEFEQNAEYIENVSLSFRAKK